jgi:oligopeptidase B
MMTSRWKPYLERGMAIGFAFVRGGGDHTEAWAAAGQVAGKALGIADFEAAVGAMQAATGLDAAATVAFGRSAGGYIVGNSVAARPGRLFAAAYMEVPYVDVLRTSSNPALPLTQYEYEEFGNPATGPAEFETVMRLSPVDVATAAPAGAYDDVFVLCRTFENDQQVFAYECLKWVDALRSDGGTRDHDGAPKLVAVRKGQGHFSFGVAASLQRAEDFVLIMENLDKQ